MGKLQGTYSGVLFHQLESLFHHGTSAGSTEGELLERFVSRRDEAAFEALLARHGPMVLGICRKLLKDPNDVDDAFQATFLVLVRKAGTLARRDLLGNWLYGVALRVAARARTLSARRSARFAPGGQKAAMWAPEGAAQRLGVDFAAPPEREPSPSLHEEISRLPEKYRTPIVLCFLEGLTHDEAARRLGWPLGTVKGRLSRAKDLLRRRLTRRGVTVSSAALFANLLHPDARAAIPAALEAATLTAAQSLARSGGVSLAATTSVSIPVAALVEGVLQTMIVNQVKTLGIPALLVAGTVVTGVVLAAGQSSSGRKDAGPARPVVAAAGSGSDTRDARSGAQDTRKASMKSTPPSADGPLHRQLSAASDVFDTLLSRPGDLEIDEIDRLSRWSYLTLQADLVLCDNHGDRVAALRAHRDRIKKLHEKTETMPISDHNQPVKADHARVRLQSAEHLLEVVKSGVGTAAMSGTFGIMGSTKQTMNLNPESKELAAAKASEPPTEQQPNKLAASAKEPVGVAKGIVGRAGMSAVGMASAMGGMMNRAMSPQSSDRSLRRDIAGNAAKLAAAEENPQNQAILKVLEQPIAMAFHEDTPLEDIIKYIKQAATSADGKVIPIYVDPVGLKEADVTLTSHVSNLDLEGVPLKTSLRLMLRQLGLAYCVRDGVLIISSVEGIYQELQEEMSAREALHPNPRLQ
jgi:RNA polymerase sigma factor (sigma-70 family)